MRHTHTHPQTRGCITLLVACCCPPVRGLLLHPRLCCWTAQPAAAVQPQAPRSDQCPAQAYRRREQIRQPAQPQQTAPLPCWLSTPAATLPLPLCLCLWPLGGHLRSTAQTAAQHLVEPVRQSPEKQTINQQRSDVNKDHSHRPSHQLMSGWAAQHHTLVQRATNKVHMTDLIGKLEWGSIHWRTQRGLCAGAKLRQILLVLLQNLKNLRQAAIGQVFGSQSRLVSEMNVRPSLDQIRDGFTLIMIERADFDDTRAHHRRVPIPVLRVDVGRACLKKQLQHRQVAVLRGNMQRCLPFRISQSRIRSIRKQERQRLGVDSHSRAHQSGLSTIILDVDAGCTGFEQHAQQLHGTTHSGLMQRSLPFLVSHINVGASTNQRSHIVDRAVCNRVHEHCAAAIIDCVDRLQDARDAKQMLNHLALSSPRSSV
eukprot:m.419661 g.419661  ORF g.419661 m.419661 type:complete len:427 (-) comp56627_c0_seq63:1118-2398(-)